MRIGALFRALATLALTATTAAVRTAPRVQLFGRTAARSARPSPNGGQVTEPPPGWEKALLQASAAGWTLGCPLGLLYSRPLMAETFGLATATFEDNIREPAAGFFALTSALGPLEALLCLSLAGAALVPEDRSRIGGALAGTSGVSLAVLAYAFATGLDAANPALVAAVVALISGTGAAGLRAARAVDDPLALYQADATDILPLVGERGSSAEELVSLFYRSSAIVGVVVGLSFLASPLSPIALFDTPEAPATHLMRQGLGAYIVFLLAPVQAALFRAAKAGTLTDGVTKTLNFVTGVCCALLVCDGEYQVNVGTRAFAAMQPGSEFYDAVTAALGDPAAVGRASTNTGAAFTVGLIVALFYIYQAARGQGEQA